MTVMEPGRAPSSAPGLTTSSTLRLRCGGRVECGYRRRRRRRLSRLRLPATRGGLQAPDFLDVRHEHCLCRILCELGPDRVRLRTDEREPFMAIEVSSLDASQERTSLVGHGVPAERVVLQLTDFVERLPDRQRYVVEYADDVDRRFDDGLRLLPETLPDQLALLLRQRRDVIDLRLHG